MLEEEGSKRNSAKRGGRRNARTRKEQRNLPQGYVPQGNYASFQKAVDSNSTPEKNALIFQPVLKDGHVYYQQFRVMPQVTQPQMILYGGRIYVASPMDEMQNVETTTIVANNAKNKHIVKEKLLESVNQADEKMRNRRTYAEFVKAAKDAQIQAAQFQQATIPDTSLVEIPEVESRPVMKPSLPYRKVYNLKELENYYSLQQFDQKNADNEENYSDSLVTESNQTQRILALRRKMATDRKKFAARKRLLSSMKKKVNKTGNADKEIFRRHCYNIRSFARQFGVLDIKHYAISNCKFIENYYPDLKCGEVETFVEHCLELFRQDEFLIN